MKNSNDKIIDMKKMYLLLLLVLPIMSFRVQNDPEAEKLLKSVSDKFASYKTVYAEFEYQLYNPEVNLHQDTKGRVWIRGNKYYAEYEGVIDLFDGKKRYLVVPENKEINVSTPAEDEEEEITPAKIFNFFKHGYYFKMDIKQPVQGRLIQYVKLLPIKEDNEVNYVLIGIDVRTKNIYKVIIVQKDKTRITLTVKKFEVNKPVSDQMFRFDKSKYPGYNVNDLD